MQRADMHSCSQLTMAASSSSLSGTSPSEAEGTRRQSDSGGTLILHNVITTTMDTVKSSKNVTDQAILWYVSSKSIMEGW